ncbi:MAG: heavy-metal-associated domain-containing protein [Cyanobacteria bacterium REEB65]|nr:heavy-metal-associated domain-containing protein [Cyanobacteria bacterium REEB65]
MFKMFGRRASSIFAFVAVLALGAPALASPVHQAAANAARAGMPAKKCPIPAKCQVPVVSQNFAIKGMFCAECARHVTQAVRKLPGVKSVHVDYQTGKGQISYVKGKVDPAAIVKVIKKAGYGAKPAD